MSRDIADSHGSRRWRFRMSKARLVITAVIVEGRSQADVARAYGVSKGWVSHDFNAKPWTPEIVAVLKHAMGLNPKQPGANHYYIHAVEASAKPGDALASAEFLTYAMPDVSHLTHMPSHI